MTMKLAGQINGQMTNKVTRHTTGKMAGKRAAKMTRNMEGKKVARMNRNWGGKRAANRALKPAVVFLVTVAALISSGVQAQEEGFTQTGQASIYSDAFEGQATASGEKYYHEKSTAAHPTLPFGTVVKITNLENNRTTAVRINDRGPQKESRIIKLPRSSARKLGLLSQTESRVQISVIKKAGEPYFGDRQSASKGDFERKANGIQKEADSKRNADSQKTAKGFEKKAIDHEKSTDSEKTAKELEKSVDHEKKGGDPEKKARSEKKGDSGNKTDSGNKIDSENKTDSGNKANNRYKIGTGNKVNNRYKAGSGNKARLGSKADSVRGSGSSGKVSPKSDHTWQNKRKEAPGFEKTRKPAQSKFQAGRRAGSKAPAGQAEPANPIIRINAGAGKPSGSGTLFGLTTPNTRMKATYIAPSIRPGKKAPKNRSPTLASGRARRSAISTSMIDGGIRMPSVPVAQLVPTVIALE